MTAWYEESFGYEYLELYAHRDAAEAREDVEAVVYLLDPPRDEPLLDLCCGACRHLFILRDMGFTQLVGLDLSQELLQVAESSLECQGFPPGKDGSIRLVCSDMREIPYEDHFSTVLSLFTSFGYFERDEDNAAVFSAVYRALKPGGRFLIDYLNRDHVIAHLVEEDEKTLPDRHIRNVRCLTEGCRRVEKTTTVTRSSGVKREFHESVRMYSKSEMEGMLSAAGLAHVVSYGSLAGRALDRESLRLIMVAEKLR